MRRTGLLLLAIGVSILAAGSTEGGTPPAAPSLPTDPIDVVEALIANPPYELFGLEKIVGPLGRDPKVWEQAVGPLDKKATSPAVAQAHVELAIDPYHQNPQKVENPGLASYQLDFRAGREASLKLLEAKLGPPVPLTKDGRRTMRYGEHFYLQGKAGNDQMTLLWYFREPDFAIPQRTGAETARLVEDVAAILKAGFTRESIESRFGKLTFDAGWNQDQVQGPTWKLTFKPAGKPSPEEVVLSFRRSIPSEALLPLLHVGVPRVVASDTHMQSRNLIDYADPHYGAIRVRGYVLRVAVEKEGLVKASEPYDGASLLWRGNPLRFTAIRASLPAPGE